jgi:TonB-dependent starch-binding outer membrane protein SusC
LASRGDTYYTGGNYGNNTFYQFNKDYIRLKNIELGYSLPNKLLDKANISNLRVFVNGLNVFTLAAQKVFDPEVSAGSGQYYPQNRVINTGLTISL